MDLIPFSRPCKTSTGEAFIKRAPAILWLVILVSVCALPVAAQADVITHHTYTFGQAATFSLTLPPESTIDEATLFLRIDTYTQAFSVPLDQGQGRYQRDLRENPIPPFAPITYWWDFKDAEGTTQSTEKTRFLYEDNRFDWKKQQDGAITVHWVSGETSIMINALDVAQEAAVEIENTLGAPAPESVTIYIYPSLPDLQSALRLAGREWVGGQAYPEYGVLLLTLPPSNEAILKMQRDVPHELTHKLLYDLTGPQGYAALPTWLNEGLATYFERSPDPAFELTLEQAKDNKTFIPLETLCHPFTGEPDDVLLAYAQSQSLLRYIQRTYGWSRLRDLVDAYADGLDCTTGAEQALGANLSQLESDWQAWLMQEERPGTSPALTPPPLSMMLRDLAPWLLLIGILFLPGIAFWLSTR